MENGADICLVVEGSYPYVTGGVSSWLQWLMKSMPDFTFSVVALISEAKTPEERQYPLPGNVLEYKEFVISDFSEIQNAPYSRMSRREWNRIYPRLYRLMIDWQKGILSSSPRMPQRAYFVTINFRLGVRNVSQYIILHTSGPPVAIC